MTQYIAYISGPITGLPDDNRPAFFAAAEQVHRMGYEVWNPAIYREIGEGVSLTRPQLMRRAITVLLRCDLIVMLPGWFHSDEADLEHFVAQSIGMPQYYLYFEQGNNPGGGKMGCSCGM